MTIELRRSVGLAVGLSLAALVAAGSTSCNGNSRVALASTCSINSDCMSPLVCAFSKCHDACTESRDCPTGERCVKSGTTGVCQPPAESTCGSGATCQSGQVCGADQQCRMQCSSAVACISGDFCVPSGGISTCYAPSNSSDEVTLIGDGVLSSDGAVIGDGSVNALEPDGSGESSGPDGSNGTDATSGTDGASGSGIDGSNGTSSEGGDDGTVGSGGNSCPSAETQFGGTAQGDSNPSFTTGIGLRTTRQLLIFDSYRGPDPVGDSGTVNYVYVQAFDPATGNSQGPATPLYVFAGPSANVPFVSAGAVAPTGEIMLIQLSSDFSLWATFLTDGTSDGGTGTAGLHVVKSFQISATDYGGPQATWSPSAKAFVVTNVDSIFHMKVQKFLPNGNSAGGSTDPVPTDNAGATVSSEFIEGYTAASNGVFGVAYGNGSNVATFTALDSLGNQIGNAVVLPTGTASAWETIGGTSAGFVYLYDVQTGGGVGELLLPVNADGGIPPAQGSDAGLPGFKFPGTKAAVGALAANDDVGGAGGVGVGILYQDNVSFAYVNADGTTHVGPSTVFSHAYIAGSGWVAGDNIYVNNAAGSFGVSQYSSASHSVQAAATGCQ